MANTSNWNLESIEPVFSKHQIEDISEGTIEGIAEINRSRQIASDMHKQLIANRTIKQWCDTCGFPEPIDVECKALFTALKIIFETR